VHPVIFTASARTELIDAQSWYENEVPGLGRRFRAEVDAAVERLRASPHQFPVIYKSIRRAILRRFPYSLLFVIEPNESLTVIACFHASRDPKRWQRRM